MTENERQAARLRAMDDLRDAIERVAHLQIWIDEAGEEHRPDPDTIVTSFVVVAHLSSMDLVERGASRYMYVEPDRDPPHVTQGLLERARAYYSRW